MYLVWRRGRRGCWVCYEMLWTMFWVLLFLRQKQFQQQKYTSIYYFILFFFAWVKFILKEIFSILIMFYFLIWNMLAKIQREMMRMVFIFNPYTMFGQLSVFNVCMLYWIAIFGFWNGSISISNGFVQAYFNQRNFVEYLLLAFITI